MIKQRGFTLVELVLTITILGVLSVGFVGFIGYGVNVYKNISSRDVIASDARFAIERLNREIRNALPNSIRILNTASVNCLEYLPIESTNVYLHLPTTSIEETEFIEVLENSSSYVKKGGHRVVVYPLDENDGYKTGNKKAKAIKSVDTNFTTNTWQIKLNSTHVFPTDSPSDRLFIVSKPISYCLIKADGNLLRYDNYGYKTPQQIPNVTGALMAENINNDNVFPFTFSLAGANSGMVQITLAFTRNGETVAFSNGVHINNVP